MPSDYDSKTVNRMRKNTLYTTDVRPSEELQNIQCVQRKTATVPHKTVMIPKAAKRNKTLRTAIEVKLYAEIYSQPMEPIYEGAKISWEIREDTLYLIGSGDMDYKFNKETNRFDIPWYYEDFTKVVFGGNITSIGPEAFHTSDLTEVTIPDSVTTIHELAFCSCKDLWNVTIGEGVTRIGMYAFGDCSSLKKLTIGRNVKIMEFDAFANCTSLRNVDLPYRLKELQDKAFGNCTSLKKIYLGSSVRLNGNPFVGCPTLKEIMVSPRNRELASIYGCIYSRTGTKLYCVPGAVTGEMVLWNLLIVIEMNAFRGGRLESVVLPQSLMIVAPGAFAECPDLKEVKFDRGCKLLSIMSDTFRECAALRNVSLPYSLNSISSNAFRDCRSLDNILLPIGLETIEESAFENAGLTHIEFPDTLVTVGDRAFASELRLKNIKFGSGPLSIGVGAFAYCTSLEVLEIPESVIEIGRDAFKGCSSLKKVILHTDMLEPEEFLPELPGLKIMYD